MKAVFDTNILIDYLNGIPQAAQELSQYNEKIISIITYMEVMVGAKTAQENAAVKAFLANFVVRPLSQKIAAQTIKLRRQHRRKLPDAIIYATAKIDNCLLVTRNTKDFDGNWVDIRIPYQI